ncbi:MAG: hypothetical protein HYU52_10980 [Acidobacteria bacterium]|nr:hypothetical protein [Acidobacteriota bacterium]
MPRHLVAYLVQKPEQSPFLLASDLPRLLPAIFPRPEWLLPRPYKIYFQDEGAPPVTGFPVLHSEVLRDLDTKLDRWLADEVKWQLKMEDARERARNAFSQYVSMVVKVAENAMLSNLLADYHAVFWLAHSFDLSRHFINLPKRISLVDTQAAKNQADAIKYRIYSKWAAEMREQMTRLAARLAPILDGEEERGLKFFRMIQDNVLILTEEFVSPDLRELRPFFNGYLHRDFFAFRDMFERITGQAVDLVKRDVTFHGLVGLFGVNAEQGIPVALMLDQKFQEVLFSQPSVEVRISREEREQLRSLSRRLQEYSVLNALRRGITWMAQLPNGDTVALDRRTGVVYSRATRPIDFGRPGVVDPMVYRFGLMYDISAFSQTLGDVARSGRKGEFSAYRQMLLFQKKLATITDRHVLQFEKFLGDGAFYTTRRALRLVMAAVEIQRFYSEMRRKGFAFNKGLRVALNYGYYRLLPLKGTPDSPEHVIEFYGPGVVELSRLTTGKATKEVEEIQAFLVAHGYDTNEVSRFFAPLATGADMVDKEMHQREFYAYVNANGHLVNEGIVSSMSLVSELSGELAADGQQLHRIQTPWSTYIGFSAPIEEADFVGIKLIGRVQLKGLGKVEVAELASFNRADVTHTRADDGETLFSLLRQEFHQSTMTRTDDELVARSTRESRLPAQQILVCTFRDPLNGDVAIYLGEWDPAMDSLRNAVKLGESDIETRLGLSLPITTDQLGQQRARLLESYIDEARDSYLPSIPMDSVRALPDLRLFLVGDTVELL